MNYDPNKYKYEIVPAPAGQPGVQILLTRLETGVVRVFPSAVHGVDSIGLHNHMQSLTDELMLDFFEKGKKKKKDKKGEPS
ncbi:hypothetical protein [Acinetobacter sp.]|uniref:hypothetical protein n=1 Tax=Acinetobacter sp. TaxID=472 RepID=UPI00388CF07A